MLLADHTKWGKIGLSSFGTLSDVDVLVTDDDFPLAELSIVREHIDTVVRPSHAD